MSLMESMRSGTDSTLMQLIFAAVVISFVAWGLGPSGDRTQSVATVNGEPIRDIDFARAYRNQERNFGDEIPTDDDIQRLRTQVLDAMIRDKALLQEARALGVEVSTKEVARQVATFDLFKDDDDRFDPNLYENQIRRLGLTRADFEQQIREGIMLSKMRQLVALGLSVSEPVVRADHVARNTRVDLRYVRVRPSAFYTRVEPSAEELEAYIADNADAIQARYDRDFARLYDLPDRVTLRVFRLARLDDGVDEEALRERLTSLDARLAAGEDPGALAAELSEDPSAVDGGLLKPQPEAGLDEAVTEALRGLEVGALSPVVDGPRDLRRYQLVAKEEARVIPLTEAQDGIATELLRDVLAPRRAASFAEDVLLARWLSDGEPPADELDELGLSPASTGKIPLSGGGGLATPPASLLQAARTANVGDVIPEVFEEAGALWVAQLSEREEADMEAFEADLQTNRELATSRQRMRFLQAWEDSIVAKADVRR